MEKDTDTDTEMEMEMDIIALDIWIYENGNKNGTFDCQTATCADVARCTLHVAAGAGAGAAKVLQLRVLGGCSIFGRLPHVLRR